MKKSFDRRSVLQGTTALGVAALASSPFDAFGMGHGAKFPSKDISVMVGTREGGGADRNLRLVTGIWKKYLKVNFEASFYPGAAGRVGYQKYMGLAKDDGYTLLFGNMGPETLNWVVSKPKGFSFPGDYVYFNQVDLDPSVIFVSAKKPKFNNIDELVAEGKKRTLNVGVSRLAHPASLGVLALAKKIGIDVNLIPLSGGKNTRKGVATGEMDFGALPSGGIARKYKAFKTLATFSLDKAEGDYAKRIYDAPMVNQKFGMHLPALASARAFAVKTSFTKKHPDRYAKLIATGKAVIEDPDFKKAVLKAKLPWNLIKWGTPEDCAAYAKEIMSVGKDFSDLMSSKKKK